MNAVTTAGPKLSGETMADILMSAMGEARGTAARYKRGDGWVDVGTDELRTTAREIARGLIALGVEHGDRVAILSNTRVEWTYADIGTLCAGAVVAPVYQTNSPSECRYVLEHSGSKVVFCENAEQLEKIEKIRSELPDLEHVIAFEDAGAAGSISLDDLRDRGKEVDDGLLDERISAIAPDDVLTIVYTSGTTGPPKGCMLTHGNFRADIEMVLERIETTSDDTYYVFLPLAHVLTRIVQMLAVCRGATLAYWQGDPKKIVEEVSEVEPTILPSVPRIFEKIHTVATTQAREAGGVKEKLFDWATGVGRKVHDAEYHGRSVSPVLKAQHALADKLVLHRIRALFGGKLRLALTGAAPIDPEILEFFGGAGVFLREGYGMTETTAVAAVNALDDFKPGTVGKPLEGCDVKIAEDGEILMRGPNIFPGYYRNEEATAETLVDGWLHSGDLGEIDDDGFLRITGRKKDLIVTSSGKNITPSNIETQLKQSRWISQAVVFGDRRPYLTALLTLDPEEAPKLAQRLGVDPDIESMAKDEKVREELQKDVDEANQEFARIEQVKKFTVLERDLTQEEGEMTPTMKVKRNVVAEVHRERFDAMYDG
jgi:long-chain acyl-CoA synthetase